MVRITSSTAARDQLRACFARHGKILERVGRTFSLFGSVEGRDHAFAHHAEGPDLRADWRPGCWVDDFASGGNRRRAKLGLSLLLASRRDLHADHSDACRLSG